MKELTDELARMSDDTLGELVKSVNYLINESATGILTELGVTLPDIKEMLMELRDLVGTHY